MPNRVLVSYGSYRSDRAGIRPTEYVTRRLAVRRVDSMKTGVRADFPKVRSALSA